VLVLDLDVHQGNGTAAMLAGEARAWTVSVHGANNSPFRKERSGLDVALRDGTEDAAYLAVLEEEVLPAASVFRPDSAFYLARGRGRAGGRPARTVRPDPRRSPEARRPGVPLGRRDGHAPGDGHGGRLQPRSAEVDRDAPGNGGELPAVGPQPPGVC